MEKTHIEFVRDEITEAAAALNLPLPKNLGDVIYTFRYRAPLPESILATAPDGRTWIIEPAGIGRYRFIACYSLQNHFRTTVPGMGQIETDEIYVGVDKRGAHHVLPVQAKGDRDKLNRVQIEQDIAMCADKLPDLVCRPIGTQWMNDDLVALFEFEKAEENLRIVAEKHYRLVPPNSVTTSDLRRYGERLADA